jgi:hypothetical protein
MYCLVLSQLVPLQYKDTKEVEVLFTYIVSASQSVKLPVLAVVWV